MNETGTRWYARTIHVDIETGERITAQQAKEYIIIKTHKYATTNKLKTHGTIEYTKLCRKNPQGKLQL